MQNRTETPVMVTYSQERRLMLHYRYCACGKGFDHYFSLAPRLEFFQLFFSVFSLASPLALLFRCLAERMESTMLRVCVFGSSSPKTPQQYKDEAFALGRLLAERRHVCVNGGGGQGVMGATNDGCRAGGGAIVGVIHEMFCVDNDEDNKIPNMIKASGPNLDERKQLLMDHSDCFLVMPGGTGTFDEVWDVVSHRSLGMKGLKGKPLVLVNTQGAPLPDVAPAPCCTFYSRPSRSAHYISPPPFRLLRRLRHAAAAGRVGRHSLRAARVIPARVRQRERGPGLGRGAGVGGGGGGSRRGRG